MTSKFALLRDCDSCCCKDETYQKLTWLNPQIVSGVIRSSLIGRVQYWILDRVICRSMHIVAGKRTSLRGISCERYGDDSGFEGSEGV